MLRLTLALLAGFVTNASTLNAQVAATNGLNAALNFKGTYGNAVVLALSGTTNRTIQWWDTNATKPFWTNTVAGDTNIAAKYFNWKGFNGSFSNFLLTNAISTTNSTWLTSIMGAYGYDTASKTSWAVIDHNSLFDSGDGGLPDLGSLSDSSQEALSDAPITEFNSSLTVQPVPEPSTYGLLILGVVSLIFVARRKRDFSRGDAESWL